MTIEEATRWLYERGSMKSGDNRIHANVDKGFSINGELEWYKYSAFLRVGNESYAAFADTAKDAAEKVLTKYLRGVK